MVHAGDDDEPLTDVDVQIDTSATDEASILTVTGLSAIRALSGTSTGAKPVEPTASAVEATLPDGDGGDDGERLTLEPSVGVRGIAPPAAPAEDEEESTTLNVEARLRKALDASRVSPRPHTPATSTGPRPRLSKSPTNRGLGAMIPPSTLEPKGRPRIPSEPAVDTGSAAEKALAAGDDQDEEETATDSSRLAGGVRLAEVAAAAAADAAREGEEEEDAPTSVRGRPTVPLSPPTLQPKTSMALLPTEPAPFPVFSHYPVATPVMPAATAPVIFPPLPHPSARRAAAEATVVVRRPKQGRAWRVVAPLLVVSTLGVLGFIEREPIKDLAMGRHAAPPTAAQVTPPPPPAASAASAASEMTPLAAASAAQEPSASAATTTPSPPAPSASDARSRPAPARKPPPAWPPPRPGASQPAPAPKGSSPPHI